MTQEIAINRPLVTFALFGYNQEKYIREAVEGAFSQTYEPLEIILSDDCSSDRTFDIMIEMAAEYQGQHDVSVVRQASNCGVMQHILSVSSHAAGDIIVVAAGDDIALETRVEILAECFSDESVVAACSAAYIFSQAEKNWQIMKKMPIDFDFEVWFHGKKVIYLNGATAAYRKSFLTDIQVPQIKIHFEDLVFSTLAAIAGSTIKFCAEPLVHYRKHDEALTNKTISSTDAQGIRARRQRHAVMHYDSCKFIMSRLNEYNEKNLETRALMRYQINKSIRRDFFISLVFSESAFKRAYSIIFLPSIFYMKELILGVAGVRLHNCVLYLKHNLKQRVSEKRLTK